MGNIYIFTYLFYIVYIIMYVYTYNLKKFTNIFLVA